jgi:hypothetical protein
MPNQVKQWKPVLTRILPSIIRETTGEAGKGFAHSALQYSPMTVSPLSHNRIVPYDPALECLWGYLMLKIFSLPSDSRYSNISYTLPSMI